MSVPDWVKVQKKTFTRWCNTHLVERQININDLQHDLQDGIILINLLEILTRDKVGQYCKAPKMRVQKLSNLATSLSYLRKIGIRLVAIGPEDIIDSNLKLILGLIWTLILNYQITQNKPTIGEAAPEFVDLSSPKNALLEWVRSKIPQHNIRNFTSDWTSGAALYDLVNAVEPGTLPEKMSSPNPLVNCTRAMDAASSKMNIPQLLDPQDMVQLPDELSNMTYISYFRDYTPAPKSALSPASKLFVRLEANDVIGKYVLDSSFTPSTSDFVAIFPPGEPELSNNYIVKANATGTHRDQVLLVCDPDYISVLNDRDLVLRYCLVNGSTVKESEVFEFHWFDYSQSGSVGEEEVVETYEPPPEEEGYVIRFNGLTLGATFSTHSGQVIHETSVYEHPEHFIEPQNDYSTQVNTPSNSNKANDCKTSKKGSGGTYINTEYLREGNELKVDFKVDQGAEPSNYDYIALCLTTHDIGEYTTYAYSPGGAEDTVKIPLDGYEYLLDHRQLVVRYHHYNGSVLIESVPFTYINPN